MGRQRSRRRTPLYFLGLAAVLALSLGAAACGGDDDDDGNAGDGGGGDAPAIASEDVTFGVPEGYDGPEAELPTEYPEPDSCEGFTIGWQNPLAANESLRAQQDGVETGVEQLGGETIVLDDEVDPDKQVSNMQQLLAQEVDAIGFFPLDPEAIDPILRRTDEQGVPVVAVERNTDPEGDLGGVDTQILQGRDIQAFNQAGYMAEVAPGASIAVFGFAVPVPSLTFWEERVQFWAGEDGLDVVAFEENQTDDAAGGEQIGNAAITANPDLEGIIAYNDPTAIGAGLAARAAGASDLTIAGLNGGEDGLDAVRDGRFATTVQLDSVGMGVQAANALCALAADPNADLPQSIVRPPTNPITQENIDTAQTWNEQIQELRSQAP